MSNPDPALSTSTDQQHLRRALRASVMLGVTVERFTRDAPSKHRARDLSVTGIRIDRAAALRPGETVLITVGALEAVGATVRWVHDDHAGLSFAEQIDPERARAHAVIGPTTKVAPDSPPPGWIGNLRNAYRQ